MNKKETKFCIECDKKFESYKCAKRKYCSPECANKKIGNNKKKTRVKVFCQFCGKEYKIIQSKLQRTKFCNSKCKNIYNGIHHNPMGSKRTIVFCHFCGSNVEVNFYKSEKQNIFYCNINCKAEHQKITQKGEGNYNFGKFKYTKEQYKKWINYKNAVRSHSYSVYKLNKDKINPENKPLGTNKYHIDHRFSTHDGFHNNVPISIMASVNNLQILNCTENLKKGIKSDITLKDLNKGG